MALRCLHRSKMRSMVKFKPHRARRFNAVGDDGEKKAPVLAQRATGA